MQLDRQFALFPAAVECPDVYVQYMYLDLCLQRQVRGQGGSMSQVVGSNSSYKPIANAEWVCTRLCKLQKGRTRLAAASDKVYRLLAQGRWLSPGTLAFSTTKTGRHDIQLKYC